MMSFKLRGSFVRSIIITVISLGFAFGLSILLQSLFDSRTLIPMIFVMGVFIISLKTDGYFFGIMSSLASVLLVNYAFTRPFYAIDLISPTSLLSAVVMLTVSVITSTLTTKIKEQEKLKLEGERERMRANLLRAVSHDLRTPLTSIYGSCSAIIENYDKLSKDKQLKHLSEIREDAEWLMRMVENLLSVTRIDGKKVNIKKTPTVLWELVDSVLIKFKKRNYAFDITLDIPDDLVVIPMDPMLIEQVILNMLENAVVHAKGMTELKFKVECDGKYAIFKISDDGCGIPQERIKNLFTGYLDRSGNPTDGTRNNMGIGLSVCYAIIRAHGSELTVNNNPDGGASFQFSLLMEENN